MRARRVTGWTVCVAVTLALAGTAIAGEDVNLISNPGFEKSQSDGDPGVGKLPAGWSISAQPKDEKVSRKDCKSTFVKAAGGAVGDYAGALTLDESDKWAYACVYLTVDEPLAAGDTIEFSVKVKSATKAAFDMYIEAWNAKANEGATARKRFNATPEWTEYELELKVSKKAEGLKRFRALVQLYTPGATLLIDDAELELERKGRDDDDDDD